MRKNTGFTLIELLVVVLIIGILAAVALPKYERAVYRSKAVKVIALYRRIADIREENRLANSMYIKNYMDLPEVSDMRGKLGEIELRTYQSGAIDLHHKNRFSIFMSTRDDGASTNDFCEFDSKDMAMGKAVCKSGGFSCCSQGEAGTNGVYRYGRCFPDGTQLYGGCY